MTSRFKVRHVMCREVQTVRAHWDIMRAVATFLEHQISGAPVVADSGRLIGILTERDCLRVAIDASYHDEPGGPVREFMTEDVESVHPDDSLIDIAERFRDRSFRRFPVVDVDRLVGIISRRDVLAAMQQGAWFRPG